MLQTAWDNNKQKCCKENCSSLFNLYQEDVSCPEISVLVYSQMDLSGPILVHVLQVCT